MINIGMCPRCKRIHCDDSLCSRCKAETLDISPSSGKTGEEIRAEFIANSSHVPSPSSQESELKVPAVSFNNTPVMKPLPTNRKDEPLTEESLREGLGLTTSHAQAVAIDAKRFPEVAAWHRDQERIKVLERMIEERDAAIVRWNKAVENLERERDEWKASCEKGRKVHDELTQALKAANVKWANLEREFYLTNDKLRAENERLRFLLLAIRSGKYRYYEQFDDDTGAMIPTYFEVIGEALKDPEVKS